jgi:outer membrane protein assembly factor BamB
MLSSRSILSLACALVAAFSSTSAQEWTRFRGPNGSGIGEAPGLPVEFSEKDFNWRVELPGHGHSSPVIWGDRVFISGSPKGTAKRVFSAVAAADGKMLWEREYETGPFRQHADNSFASASPAVDAERVYGWWASPEGSSLVALAHADGTEVWRQDFGPFIAQHGSGASPIVFEDLVILNFDHEGQGSFVAAYEAATGKQRWKLERQSSSSTASTPCIYEAAGAPPQLILIGRTTGMTSVDPRKGTVNWQLPDLMPRRCVASPIVAAGGLLIAQCGEGSAESFVAAVRADGSRSAEKVYDVVRVGGYVPTPIAVGELLFLWKENGLVTCLRAADRKELWSERVEGPFYGSPVCVNGRLYNMTRRGELVVLNGGPKFQQLARISLDEGSHATPAVSGGRMYLRTFTHLISVGK